MALIKSARTALVASCLAVVALAAHADLLDDIMKAKKIRISTDVAIPPAGMMDANMKPTGSDVETNSSRPPAPPASPTSTPARPTSSSPRCR